ncbi:hypothetical protein ACWGH8_13865 [Nonomuraea muscovyensis]
MEVRHIDHPNPTAQGDIFCDGNHLAHINTALHEIDWLPGKGWNRRTARAGQTRTRTLIEVLPMRAAGIRRFSAFTGEESALTGEEEFVLAPGTQLEVTDVRPSAAACAPSRRPNRQHLAA